MKHFTLLVLSSAFIISCGGKKKKPAPPPSPPASPAAPVAPSEPVTSIIVSPHKPNIKAVNGTVQLTAAVFPLLKADKEVTWSTSDPSKATVSNTGLETEKANGGFFITATSVSDKTKSASSALTIGAAVESVSLNHASVELKPGATLQFAHTILPSNAANQEVNYSVPGDNASIAAIDDKGLLTAKSEGTVNVLAMSKFDNDKYAICLVRIVK